MWQTVLVYAIVAAAASWVTWRVLLPAHWRDALRARIERVRGRTSPARIDACACGRDGAD